MFYEKFVQKTFIRCFLYYKRSRFRNYTGTEASGVVHHGLPEELSAWFTERGVDVNDPKYYYDLDVGTHNRIAQNVFVQIIVFR